MRQWSHVQLFSPWEYNIDKASARLLQSTGWNSPDPQAYPTGGELFEQYLEPLATRTPLRDRIRTESRVIGRFSSCLFEVRPSLLQRRNIR